MTHATGRGTGRGRLRSAGAPAGASPPPTPPSLTDGRATLADLKALVARFVAERDWNRYHTPRNVAVSIVLEAGELLEHFQWSPPAPDEMTADRRQEIGEEMADVLAYLLSLANVLDLDLSAALEAKMRKNRRKYPVEWCQGHWEKPKEPAGGTGGE